MLSVHGYPREFLIKDFNLVLRRVFCAICFSLISCAGNIKDTDLVNAFISRMVTIHQFDEAELNVLFMAVEIKEDILKKISSPAEGMPWYKYRKIFMTDSRINGGLKFWKENQPALTVVEKQTGVPPKLLLPFLVLRLLMVKRRAVIVL